MSEKRRTVEVSPTVRYIAPECYGKFGKDERCTQDCPVVAQCKAGVKAEERSALPTPSWKAIANTVQDAILTYSTSNTSQLEVPIGKSGVIVVIQQEPDVLVIEVRRRPSHG